MRFTLASAVLPGLGLSLVLGVVSAAYREPRSHPAAGPERRFLRTRLVSLGPA